MDRWMDGCLSVCLPACLSVCLSVCIPWQSNLLVGNPEKIGGALRDLGAPQCNVCCFLNPTRSIYPLVMTNIAIENGH